MGDSTRITWKRTEFLIASKLHIPVLEGFVDVLADPEDDSASVPSPSQLCALNAFPGLGSERRGEWTHQVALYCGYTCLRSEVHGDEPPVCLRKREEVWRFVQLQEVFVPRHAVTRDRYTFVYGDCDWEKEHALELLFKNEILFRVAPQEGLAQNEEWSRYFIDQ